MCVCDCITQAVGDINLFTLSHCGHTPPFWGQKTSPQNINHMKTLFRKVSMKTNGSQVDVLWSDGNTIVCERKSSELVLFLPEPGSSAPERKPAPFIESWHPCKYTDHTHNTCTYTDTQTTRALARPTEVPIFCWIALGSLLFLPGAGGSCVSNPVRMRGMRSPDVAQVHCLHQRTRIHRHTHVKKMICRSMFLSRNHVRRWFVTTKNAQFKMKHPQAVA